MDMTLDQDDMELESTSEEMHEGGGQTDRLASLTARFSINVHVDDKNATLESFFNE